MKRNRFSQQSAHRSNRTKGKSRYAAKVAKGQMYGPGCCAHRITDAQLAAHREEVRRSGHLNRPIFSTHHGA